MSDHLTDAELDELERKAKVVIVSARTAGLHETIADLNTFHVYANPKTVQRLISEIRERRKGETR